MFRHSNICPVLGFFSCIYPLCSFASRYSYHTLLHNLAMSFSVMVSKGVPSWDGGKCLQNISALTQLSRPSGETQPLLSSPGWCNRLCKTHRRALKTQSHQKLKVNPYSFLLLCHLSASCVLRCR